MRVLITGASGMLGSNMVLAALESGHEVVATSFSRPVCFPGVHWQQADLSVAHSAAALLVAVEAEGVIHCAAATDVDRCEDDPRWAYSLNRDMAEYIATAAAELGAALIHISTDAVFDGSSGPHNESDEARPINVYGSSKLQGEQAVESAHSAAAIVRTNFFGWSPRGRLNLAEWFLENLRAGRRCLGFTDIRANLLLVNELCSVLVRMLESELSGVYHVASQDPVSKYEFGTSLADVFELDSSLIEPAHSEVAGLSARRPKDLSMQIAKVERDLEVSMPRTRRGINDLRTLREAGYRERLEALVREPAQS